MRLEKREKEERYEIRKKKDEERSVKICDKKEERRGIQGARTGSV